MKGAKIVKTKVSNIVKAILKGSAKLSSESTSLVGLYQPKTPKSLVKSNKK